jgi:4-hydroxy-tetrahydrodipicolinate reductase
MGQAVVKAVWQDEGLVLAGAVDVAANNEDVGEAAGLGKIGVQVQKDLLAAIKQTKPDVLVDFTVPKSVMGNIKTALENGVSPVVGTTGLSAADLEVVKKLCQEKQKSALIAPNFAIGAILMLKLSQEVAKYMPQVEIIELHHDQKLDAPSGTAARTAELIRAVRGDLRQGHPDEFEKIPGARGGDVGGIKIHSIRLPGYVAHQEVIFGGLGQTLSIRHDSISRESFMPGVVLACKKILQAEGLIYGLENMMD